MNEALSLTAVCILVVFSVLALLTLVYTVLGYFYTGKMKKIYRVPKAVVKKKPQPQSVDADDDLAAAVTLALHLYDLENMHDTAPTPLTINRTDSPWKIRIKQK